MPQRPYRIPDRAARRVGLMAALVCLAAAACPAQQPGLRGFGLGDDDPVVPGFGGGRVVERYSRDNLDTAGSIMRRYDDNEDGSIDRRELAESRWRWGDPFGSDYDRDGRLSRIELAQWLAVRDREEDSNEIEKYSAVDAVREQQDSRGEDLQFRHRSASDRSSRSSRELAYSLVVRFDRDRNRALDAFERKDLGIDAVEADLDGDGLLRYDEIDEWMFEQIDRRVQDLSDVLPNWFFERDADGDRQIQMSEFATEWTDEELERFASIDTNGDGVIVPEEMANAKSIVGGSYTSETAMVLAPRRSVVSEIAIDDPIVIEKLSLQLSITHNEVETLDAHLIAPTGEKIELFTAVGGSGDHFESTVFDDEADDRIERARPPFRGTFQPEAVEKKSTSFASLKGKSLQGVWKLSIDCSRNTRFGLLHSWSLIVDPAEDADAAVDAKTADDKAEDDDQDQDEDDDDERST